MDNDDPSSDDNYNKTFRKLPVMKKQSSFLYINYCDKHNSSYRERDCNRQQLRQDKKIITNFF
jgi:hypothetical protein